MQSGKTAHKRKTLKKVNPLSPDPKWDVIVIGSGIGGASAGAICASHGLKTLILEKNPRPGGACSYYEKDGFRFDTGTHLFVRGNKGPFGICTRRLGMGTPIEFRRTRKIVRVLGMNLDLTISKGKLGMFLVLIRVIKQLQISPSYFPDIFLLMRDIIFMSQHKIEVLDAVSVENFLLQYTKTPEVQAIFGMLFSLFSVMPTQQSSAGEAVWNIRKLMFEENLCYPKGGAAAVPNTILEGAKRHSAQVWLNATVKKIQVENNHISGVLMENGEMITASTVISTTSLYDTILSLTGREHFPEDYTRKIEQVKGSWAPVQAKIAVRKKLVEAGCIVAGVPLKLDEGFSDKIPRDVQSNLENGEVGNYFMIYAPVPTNFDQSLAPDGCQIITAATVAPTLDIPLKDEPAAWIDAIMNTLYKVIPGLKENILFYDSWSVKNIANWMGKRSGSAIATAQIPSGHHTPVRGLYMAGDSGGAARGVGTELACQSGMNCGDLVIRDKVHTSPVLS
ncbi:MAG: NAD(P)/FAD-dependent oxidoreductase [Deltaproteobacteria bacterium]|nr:NAD(P)/FAD-dependent oxidoreductase [Deltaproteobacteria bacterium]